MPHDVKTLQIDRNEFQQTLDKKLADLPPLPTVVTKIMETVNDPNTSAEDLNRLISLDQGLSSKVLRIVNSAYYGFPKRISTLTHAVVILGYNTVRNLVLGVSAFGMLGGKGHAAGLDRGKFWSHSIAAAVASSAVAKAKKPKNRAVLEEAFIAGLLHDFGKLFLDCYFPVQYAVTLAYAQKQNIPLIEAEKTVLGIDHAFVGKRVGEQWNFPASLVASLGQHHYPMETSEHFESAAVAQVADFLAWRGNMGISDKLPMPELTPRVAEWLAMTEEELDVLVADMKTQHHAACEMLQLQQAA
jgi:HD-like signal output (HDOD) protein